MGTSLRKTNPKTVQALTNAMVRSLIWLQDASPQKRRQLVKVANRMLPIFVDHSMWRPKARASIAGLMRERDIQMLQHDLQQGARLAASLGIDVSDLELPKLN